MTKNPFVMFLASLGFLFLLMIILAVIGIYSFTGEKPSILKSDTIGVIKIEGLIFETESLLKQIEKLKDESHIKAVVLKIESPGGVVGPSQELYQAVKELKESKKVVAALGGIATSGAYYVACAADRIIANPGTMTGSIGVIMEFFNLEKLYQWAKMDASVIKSGRYKDIGSPLRPMQEDERQLLKGVIDNVSQQFKRVVQVERKISVEKLDEITDGRIFSGEQAKQVGLVDELGNFRKAVEVAKSLGGIKGEPELFYPPKEKKMLLQYFLGESVTKFLDTVVERQAMMVVPLFYLPGFYR